MTPPSPAEGFLAASWWAEAHHHGAVGADAVAKLK